MNNRNKQMLWVTGIGLAIVALLLVTAKPSRAEGVSILSCEELYRYSLELVKAVKGQQHDEAQAGYYLGVISASISIHGSPWVKHPLSLDMAASRSVAYAAREVGLWLSKNRSTLLPGALAPDCVYLALVETYGYK